MHHGRAAVHATGTPGNVMLAHVDVSPPPHVHHDHAAMMSDPAMAKAMERDMARRFWIALVLTIPIVAITGHMPGLPMLVHPPMSSWIALLLSTPVVLWCGSIFLTGSVHALRKRKLDMSVLIATGVLAAYLSSLYLTAIGYPTAYYEAAAMLVTFVLFGHWMEMKSRRGTSDALRALFDLVPPTARVIRNGKEQLIPTSEVIVGDGIRLLPGEKVPVDGEVTEGETEVDEALVTGESEPVHKASGDAVVGGSINTSGAVTMRATRVGSDTVLAQIAALVERAQNSKAPGQRIADKAAAVLVIVAVSAGIITFLAWTLLADEPFLTALTFAISAVVIACPDALGLATPTAVAVGTGLGARRNILIKDAATLEGVSRIQVIVLDKTGTLTIGKPTVTDVLPIDGITESDLLSTASRLSASSTHPLSQAIVRAAAERRLDHAPGHHVRNVPGSGIQGSVDEQSVLVGNARLLADNGVETAISMESARRLAEKGRSLTFVARAGSVLGVIGITDAIRPSSKEAIQRLKDAGVRPVLMSGDAKPIVERVALEVGIDQVFAEVKPADKAAHVKELQSQGFIVGMVGDGINDAPALAQADIGIAIGAGTDVAAQAAQVILMKSDPLDIVRAIKLSKATVRKMKQNLAWASVYNLLAIPIAAGAFYTSLGWSLRPEVSALLMSVSSIIVALNAVSLRRARI
ncbi:MAG TPA: copper-translocating P-type ATPase [Gemmatimonadaceae bacterium]|nr:copper-translocating P-type ATPase [Gemmatimonadaceae bacterium]